MLAEGDSEPDRLVVVCWPSLDSELISVIPVSETAEGLSTSMGASEKDHEEVDVGMDDGGREDSTSSKSCAGGGAGEVIAVL
jgi:hypothetical protein